MILIALEDTKSSKLYVESFRKEVQTDRIIVIAEHRGSDPKNVVLAAKEANEVQKKLVEKDQADGFNEVWVVFDTEGPQHPRASVIRNAIQQALDLGFIVSVSNPSFEYWFLLHYGYYTQQFQNGAAVIKELKRHVKDYSKNKDMYQLLRPLTEVAIEHSRRIFRERGIYREKTHPCDCWPSTQVHKLIQSILGQV
ncbi:MAG TPA: RloB family protein [Fimbriiglobus sp.]|jgi:hypothetical protein